MLEKTFDPATAEPRLYEAWAASGAFAPERALARDPHAEPFAMVIPPPNVTGALHVGHALNMTLQDVLARFHRMRGRAVLWLPGTDHAGIATQMMVERQLAAEGNVGRRELGREAFLERVWAWKAGSGGAIAQQLRRLGASCDWGRERFTLDEGLSRAVRKVFVELHRQGLIYRAKRLVNWHPELQTAISDLEVENVETKGSMWRFRYPLEPLEAGGGAGEAGYIVVATTRPETLLGDAAVAVHPDDARYRHLVGRMVRLPLADRLIPIVADDHADPEKGSGAVKITPAHDFNDFAVGARHDLPLINVFDTRARLNEAAPEPYRGMDRFAARKRIVADMEARGLLEGVDSHLLALPYDEKSKSVVIEPYLTDQWWVDAKTLAGPALAAVEDGRTVFEPKAWEKTYFDWMRNIEPWCISRQLWWGHRIPAWYIHRWLDDDFKPEPVETIVCETAEEADAEILRRFGSNVLRVENLSDAQSKVAELGFSPSNGPLTVYMDEDVLDTWFSSALWPFSTLGWPDETTDLQRFYPTDTLVTGFDIIFFWVARMMMMGLQFMGEVPFRRVVINGLVRDERGQKMSKTKGNVIDPLEVIDRYGADALRFTLAILSGTRDIKLAPARIEGYRNFGTKLWNAARFCQMNECVAPNGFDPGAVAGVLNRWLRGETVKTVRAVTEALEAAEVERAAEALYRFVWNLVCDWGLELAKPVLNGEDEAAKAETRATLAWTLDQALKLLHPVSPFITEALWAQTAEFGPARDGLLIEAAWPDLPDAWIDPEAEAEIGWLIALVTEVRSVRAEMNLPPAAKPALTLVGDDADSRRRLTGARARLCALGRLGAVREAEAAPAGAVAFVAAGAEWALDVAAFVDLQAERARLEKTVASAEQDAARVSRKLANPDFVARAKPEVVEDERRKLAETEGALAKLRAALGRLERMG